MLIPPYSTSAAWMPAGCSVFRDFSVAWLVTARNHRRKDGLPLGWHEAFPPLMEILGSWAVLLREAQGIYRSSVNCIFSWTCHENVVVKYWNRLIRELVGPPSLEMLKTCLNKPWAACFQEALGRTRWSRWSLPNDSICACICKAERKKMEIEDSAGVCPKQKCYR